MRILTESEAQEQLSNPQNLTNRINLSVQHRVSNGKGKTLGTKDLSQEKRLEIATLSESLPQTKVAEIMEVSQGTVSSIVNGRLGGREFGPNNEELKTKRDERLDKIKDHALTKMMEAFGLMDNEKLAKASARDLASIAKDMAKVIKDTSEETDASKFQVIIYAPSQKSEESYDVINV